MKKKSIVVVLLVSLLIFITSLIGLNKFEEYVNNSDGVKREYKFTQNSENEDVAISIDASDSWFKALPEDFKLDEHFTDSEFARRNDVNLMECIGQTIQLNIENVSDFRINKWDIRYEVPCDMYLDKAWNGMMEIHQFGGKNVDTISTTDMPIADTPIVYNEVTELYLIPLKKGDTIIYRPADFEVPIAESAIKEVDQTTKNIGFIVYTEDEGYAFENFVFEYNIIQSLEDYPLYTILTLLIMVFGIASLGSVIILFVTLKYDTQHKRDRQIISQAIGTFSKFIDSKDKYTNNHSYRVAGYSKLIASKLKLPESECEDVYFIGLLHDTGKVIIDDKILNKPGRLTSQEYEVIKSHTTKGADLLKDFTAIKDISVGALYHHERYDGKGYPSGLAGENIPLVARIICVADAYDAMSSNRCYRAELDRETIIEQLVINKGKQFDPRIVDVFLECIESGEVDSVRRSCIES